MDSNSSKMLFFLFIFIFMYGVIAGGLMYTFGVGAEPTTGDIPPEPTGGGWWGTLSYLGTITTYLLGLGTGFSTFGVPAPFSWIFAGMFWICVASLILLLIRG